MILNFTGRDFVEQEGFGVDFTEIADIDSFKPTLRVDVAQPSAQIHFPYYGRVVSSSSGDSETGAEASSTQDFTDSATFKNKGLRKYTYLAERSWDLPETSDNPSFFFDTNYTLSTYEISELQDSTDALNGTEANQRHYIDYICVDNTATLYEEYVRKPFHEALLLFEAYADNAADFCSSNNGVFNDFFISSMNEKYANIDKPWEVGPYFYTYLSALVDVSWDEGRINRVRNRIWMGGRPPAVRLAINKLS